MAIDCRTVDDGGLKAGGRRMRDSYMLLNVKVNDPIRCLTHSGHGTVRGTSYCTDQN